MEISHVLTAVNDSKNYTRFIPLFIKYWEKLYPNIKPLIIFIGEEIPEEYIQYKDNIIKFDPIEGINTPYMAQTIRLLWPAIVDTTGSVLISDMDMIPANDNYFKNAMVGCNINSFVSLRPEDIIGHEQIPMCYNSATPEVWSSVFGIKNQEDIIKFLKTHHKSEFDGKHGGKGWYTDQQLLSSYVMNWKNKGNSVEFVEDYMTGFNRLGHEKHHYNIDTFLNMVNTGNFSDSHFYAFECPWTQKDINTIINKQ